MLKTASTLKLVCFLFVLLSFNACNEDTIEPKGEGSIAGVVLDAETGEPIAAAGITTTPATSAIVTDAAGAFSLTDIPGGDYSISIKKTGYQTQAISVAVKNGTQTPVTVLMESANSGDASLLPSPANPTPATEAQDQPVNVTLTWQSEDTAAKDSLTYNVWLFESGSPQKKKLADGISDTSVVATGLKYNTTYFWQVIAKDRYDNAKNGEVWSFKTLPVPDQDFLFVKETEGNYDIYSADSGQTSAFQLTTGFSREWWPRLNPLNDHIAYSSNVGIEPQIYTMNRDGSNKRQVTTLPVVGYHNQGIGFSWSPDGSKILYANYDNLYTINRDGSNLTLIAKAPANRNFRSADWTNRGNKIVVQTIGSNINDSEIYIMDANGANMKPVVQNIAGRVESPSFSIDGSRILHTRDLAGFESADGRQLDTHIFTVATDGSGLTDLSTHKPAGTNDLDPRFSPDGAKVIFVNTSNTGNGLKEIWMLEIADPKSRRRLFSDAEMPEWK